MHNAHKHNAPTHIHCTEVVTTMFHSLQADLTKSRKQNLCLQILKTVQAELH